MFNFSAKMSNSGCTGWRISVVERDKNTCWKSVSEQLCSGPTASSFIYLFILFFESSHLRQEAAD